MIVGGTYIRPRNDEFIASDTALCLGASHNMSPLNNRCVVICFSGPQDHCVSRGFMAECAPTLNAAAGMSGNNRPFIVKKNGFAETGKGCRMEHGVSSTLRGEGENRPSRPSNVIVREREVFPINSMVVGKEGNNGDRQTFGIGKDGDPCPTLQTSHHHACAVVKKAKKVFGIDQQGGKGGANFTEDVAPTVLSDSHGTPHAICLQGDEGCCC